MQLSRDFKEFLQSLNDSSVRYLVLGGYAVAYYGHPRYTKDLDVWIESSQENAEKLVHALDQFGFGALNLSAEDFLGEGQVVQMGVAPHRIDILNFADGINFSECYNSRQIAEIEGVKIAFLDIENLKTNKRASGRLQDLADVENLGDVKNLGHDENPS